MPRILSARGYLLRWPGEKLNAGAKVADVGCGHGASTILMAQAYPQSTFVGFDYHALQSNRRGIRRSRQGVSDRVSFEVAKAKDYPGTTMTWWRFLTRCTTWEIRSGPPLMCIGSLKSDGSWMIVEPFANDKLEDNLNPIGRIFYSASTMLCTPASRSQEVGLGLGAQAGEARIRRRGYGGRFQAIPSRDRNAVQSCL